MNDEIREILKNIKRQNEWNGIEYFKTPLSTKDANKLLDYITNLQQENEEWAMIFDTFSKRPYAHKYLEEKRKELGNDKIIGLDSEMIYKDYYDYKSRVEKTTEKLSFIDEALENDTLNVPLCIAKINSALNILQNGSESNE